jgi:hypothetical protein
MGKTILSSPAYKETYLLIFEETEDGLFREYIGKNTIGHTGGIHPSRKGMMVCVHVLYPDEMQAYLVSALHRVSSLHFLRFQCSFRLP